MENSRRAVDARVTDKGADFEKFLETYPRFDGEKMPTYWARLHHILDGDETKVERVLTQRTEPDPFLLGGVPYKPTKAHQNFAVEPVKPKADSRGMDMSGFCAWPGRDNHGHALCHNKYGCRCDCHEG